MQENGRIKTHYSRLPITRHDFLNSTLLASSAILLGTSPRDLLAGSSAEVPDDFTGYGGLGDYADSNGNTRSVVSAGHTIRDHAFDAKTPPIQATGELFDCLVIGAGISGLSAALFFHRDPRARARTCLIIDNHPMFGGEAKRNEFEVDGQPLISHQGSAMFFPPLPGTFLNDFYPSVGIDWTQFQYQHWSGSDPAFPVTNTPYFEGSPHSAFYFGTKFGHPEGLWLTDPWGKQLAGAPVTPQIRAEWLRIHEPTKYSGSVRLETFTPPKQHGDSVSRALDAITLEQHLCNRYGVSPETVRTFVSPIAGGGSGLGADVLSGYSDIAADVLFPWQYDAQAQMFPGGNTGVARHLVKALIPDAIPGPVTLANVCRHRIDFSALDRPASPTRIRLGATVISVRHLTASSAGAVEVTYLKGGQLYRVHARSAIMANGSWTTKHILRDLPADHQAAYAQFHRAPCLMANVAVRNWRFLYDAGIHECQWFEGIGNYFAVRRMATFGGGNPALNPGTPVVLTLKILFSKPGLSIAAQTAAGRTELLSTPFLAYERQIREQFTQMFARFGFDASRDIGAIILNRWGHAYLAPQPGFFFGSNGQPAPGDFLRNHPYGFIAFANSDLAGIMDHRASIMEARRAANQVLNRL